MLYTLRDQSDRERLATRFAETCSNSVHPGDGPELASLRRKRKVFGILTVITIPTVIFPLIFCRLYEDYYAKVKQHENARKLAMMRILDVMHNQMGIEVVDGERFLASTAGMNAVIHQVQGKSPQTDVADKECPIYSMSGMALVKALTINKEFALARHIALKMHADFETTYGHIDPKDYDNQVRTGFANEHGLAQRAMLFEEYQKVRNSSEFRQVSP